MFTKGQAKIGGRTPGIRKIEQTAAEICSGMQHSPILGMIKIARGDVPCAVCHGAGKTKFQPLNGDEPGERTCQSCWGSGKEAISPELRGKMEAELAKYVHPQLRSIEHSGEIGQPDLAAILRERFNRRVLNVEPQLLEQSPSDEEKTQ